MVNNRDFWVFIGALLALGLLTTFTLAEPNGGHSTTGQTGSFTSTSANSVTTQGGNVTFVNVSSNQSTTKWQGFLGNVSGSLTLGDGTDTFYDWSSVTFQAIFATPGTTINWSNVSNITTTPAKQGKDTDYGFTSSDPDSIDSTMTGTTCAAGTVLANAAGVTPLNATGGAGNWTTCIGEQSGGAVTDTVFGTNIIAAGDNAYDNSTQQYQLMVPVNATGQLYYLYLEI